MSCHDTHETQTPEMDNLQADRFAAKQKFIPSTQDKILLLFAFFDFDTLYILVSAFLCPSTRLLS